MSLYLIQFSGERGEGEGYNIQVLGGGIALSTIIASKRQVQLSLLNASEFTHLAPYAFREKLNARGIILLTIY